MRKILLSVLLLGSVTLQAAEPAVQGPELVADWQRAASASSPKAGACSPRAGRRRT